MNLAGAAALGGPSSPFAPIVAALMPNGPGGPFCQSAASPNDGGVYSGASVGCFNQSLDFDGMFNRSEEHTSELQSLMRNSYAVFCLKKKNTQKKLTTSRI